MPAPPRFLIAGNWKMHGTAAFAADLAGALAAESAAADRFDMLVCPPAPLLAAARAAIGSSALLLGGQDCHAAESGAHTGDVSAAMLADAGCSHVIVGHSERRAGHGEDSAAVRDKATAAQAAGLVPVVCVGETLEERDTGRAVAVVRSQLAASLPAGSSADSVIVAYEPVWAIGTGRTPTPEDVAKIHGALRAALEDLATDAAAVRILYGGSVKPDNAGELLGVENVNGALVGGASLAAAAFRAIAESCP